MSDEERLIGRGPGAEDQAYELSLRPQRLAEYVGQVRDDVAQERMDAIKTKGIDGFSFAWMGPAEKDQPHYYRIHGGDFVVEFDNRQDGANHIHSVWRDVENDFASDVLRDHLLLYHVI